MGAFLTAGAVLVSNLVWAWRSRLTPLWPALIGGVIGCLLLLPGAIVSPGFAGATVAIAQLLAVSAVQDARSFRLPLPVTKLLYMELAACLLVSVWFGDFRVGAITGAAIWVAALVPGAVMSQLGFGDVLIAPAMGAWLGAAAGPMLAFLALSAALLLAAAQGLVRQGRIPLGPWLYLAWLGAAALQVSAWDQ